MRLAVIGTGLIGTSVAMAAATRAGAEVVGWDSDAATLAEAAEASGLVAASSLAEAVDDADAVVVAVPGRVLTATVAEALAASSPDALVTDVGSTKLELVEATADPRFVGGHPLAGAETGGPSGARGDLFEGATWYLTPVDSTAGVQLEMAFRLASDLGARPRALPAAAHDRILATVSHLPHVLANVLVAEADETLAEEGEPLPAIGPSFRDATRVAGAPSAIWTDIYLGNAEALAARLDRIERRIAAVRQMLVERDAEGLTGWNDSARTQRDRVASEPVSGGPAVALTVEVPNRPGVVAEIALALGGAGIDLSDLQLHPAADRSTGTIVLWVEGTEAAAKAGGLIEGLGHRVTGL